MTDLRVLYLGHAPNPIVRGRVAPFLGEVEARWISTGPAPDAFLAAHPRLRVDVSPRAWLKRLPRQLYAHTADYVSGVLRTIASFRPHLIHAHYVAPLDALALLPVRNTPIVLTVMGGDVLDDQVARPAALDAALRDLMQRAAAVTAKSEFLAARCRALGASRVELVRWGVDTTVFQPGDRASARRALGLPVDDPILLSSRALRPLYNHGFVIDAVADMVGRRRRKRAPGGAAGDRLQRGDAAEGAARETEAGPAVAARRGPRSATPPAVAARRGPRSATPPAVAARRGPTPATPPPLLVFTRNAADGAHAQALAERARTRGVRTRFLESLPPERMPELYAAADACVSVPASDGLPQTLLEALACGRPCLSLDLPAYAELPFTADALVRVRHWAGTPRPRDLQDGIRQVLAEQERPGLAAALAWIKEHAELRDSVAQVRALYRELTNGHGSHGT